MSSSPDLNLTENNKVYTVFVILRRTVWIGILLLAQKANSEKVIGILSALQLIYLIYICILHPFKDIKSNIIEAINETYLLVLISSLLHLNNTSAWTQSFMLIYIWVLSSNSMIIFLIFISKFLHEIL